MRLRATIAAALVLFAAPAFAQNVAEVGGSVGGVGSISLGAVGINQPILPTTINAAAPGVCPANQYETQDTTTGPVCAQPSFAQLTGTASNSQLAGPLVSLLAVPAQFTISNPGGVGTATVGYTANALAAHNFGTGIDLTGKLTGAQPAFSDVSGTATDAQLANAYSGVGACGANTFTTTLSRNAAPTCTQPASTNLSDTVASSAWTPTLRGSSTAGTVTYSVRLGRYTQIGSLVVAEFNVAWSAFSGAAGTLQLTGLPVATANNAVSVESALGDVFGITYSAGNTWLSIEIEANSTIADVTENGSGSSGGFVLVTNVGASGFIAGTLVYLRN